MKPQNDPDLDHRTNFDTESPTTPLDRNIRLTEFSSQRPATEMTIQEFVKCLANSGLIPAAEIGKLKRRISQDENFKDAESLTSALLKEHWVSEYQAKVILGGDSDSLILGNYIILDKIGVGGMGCVYRAWHRRMKRIVAIKTLLPETSQSRKSIQRFHQEVAAAAQLVHRNIVTAFDADEVNGIHFLVMEYVDGSDLAAVVHKHGPFHYRDAIRCILDAARGLEYAHQQGIIHRDIKPSNLLLDSNGMVKLLDLGLAQANDVSNLPTSGLTSVGALVGTTDYLAPEQAMSVKQADCRSDVYSLGVSFFYIATGFIPFPGETVLAKLVAHREKPIPSLSQFRQGAPKELDEICARMLAKDPQHRYASMRELIVSLEDCLRNVFNDPLDGSPIRLPSDSEAIDRDNRSDETKTMRQRMIACSTRSPVSAVIGIGVTLVAALIFFPRLLNVDRANSSDSSQRLVESGSDPGEIIRQSPREIFARLFPEPPEHGTALVDAAAAQQRQLAWTEYLQIAPDLTNSVGMQLRVIPPGVFRIGSAESEQTKLTEEANQKGLPNWYLDLLPSETPYDAEVIFPLLLSAYEVTQAQYDAVMGSLPDLSEHLTDARIEPKINGALPVGRVSWFDAVRFCNALSEQEGFRPCYVLIGNSIARTDGDGYRLPSEAEWEYACRAGTSTRWHFGEDASELSRYCVFGRTAMEGPEAVGSRRPNPWGLYDMYGNMWEWCEDAFAPNAYPSNTTEPPEIETPPKLGRVVRGGSFSWTAEICRSSNRAYYVDTYRGVSHGFRVLRQVRSSLQRSTN